MAPARTVDTWRRGETEAEIGKQLAALSPIRLIAAVRQFRRGAEEGVRGPSEWGEGG